LIDDKRDGGTVLVGLSERVQRLQEQQEQAYDDLRTRLVDREMHMSKGRVLPPDRDDLRDENRRIYDEVTAGPSIGARIVLLTRDPVSISTFLIGLVVALARGTISRAFTGYYYPEAELTTLLVGVGLFVVGLLLLVRRLSSIESFYSSRNRILQTMYVRGYEPSDLLEVSSQLEEYLARLGPTRGRVAAARKYGFDSRQERPDD
jgi:hypothetical protein